MGKDRDFGNAQSLLGWQVLLTIFHSLALGFTVTRLVHRCRARKIWWDDNFVLLPLVTDIMYIAVTWTIYFTKDDRNDEKPYRTFVISSWFSLFMVFTIIWTSRICLSLSLARVFKTNRTCRRFAFCLVAIFTAIYLTLISVNTFTCQLGRKWYDTHKCEEVAGRPLGYVLAIAFDFLSGILLLISPLVILRRVKLRPKDRSLMLCLFASSIFTLLTSVMFSVTWYNAPKNSERSQRLINMTSSLQVASCLLVCNLLVATKLFYRAFLEKKVESDNDIENDQTADGAQATRPTSLHPPSSTQITLTSIYDDLSLASFRSSIRSWMMRTRSAPSTSDSQRAPSVSSFHLSTDTHECHPGLGFVRGGSYDWRINNNISKEGASMVPK